MKIKILLLITIIILSFPKVHFGQAPNLGTAANFVLYTTAGGVSNVGITHLTGNVGSNSGLSTAFGNVDGQMHDNDGVSGQCATDLLIAYNQLNSTIPTLFPAPLLGNGQILTAGVYAIPSPATINLDLILDGGGNANAVFIFQIQGSLSTNASAKVKLINGAKACNVFWKVEGLVSMGAGSTMRGTIVANNAAINMSTGDTLEGRALSTAGAITVSGILGYTPIGCGSVTLNGPIAPNLASADCYEIFSTNGPVTNVGVSNVIGDIGTNNGSVTGFNPLFVVGAIHGVPDGSTAACATDLNNAFLYLNTLPFDIELLYPAQFGNNLVLTPHTYLMNSAASFTDSLYLNAQGNVNAVFVIRINGALSTSVNSRVILLNGTQSKNVYWLVNGAVTINDNSIFRGSIICNNGAINLNTGVTLDGRALTTTGAINTAAINASIPLGSCGTGLPPTITTQPTNQTVCDGSSATFTVSATGTSLTYQWRKGLVNLINGGNISGATTATLTINPASITDVSANYNVVISGAVTPSVVSNNVSLIINTAPIITSQPSNQIACIGSSVTLTMAASGAGLNYQWRKGLINIINGGSISGATTASLTINPVALTDVALNYNVVVSGACLPDATSINASLSIGISPTITSQPSNQTACEGSPVTFTVVAIGTGLNYQWRKGLVNLINGGAISGATTASLTINPTSLADAAINYNVVVSGGCLPDAISNNASLSINSSPTITSQPSNQTTCLGSSVTFTTAANGTGITYQWRKGLVNLINGGAISGATTASLTINPVTLTDAALNYNVVVSGTCLPDAISNNVSLIIGTSPTITSQPTNQTVCEGSSVTFTVAVSGTGLSYQWRKGLVNLINGGSISGATTASLTINPTTLTDAALNYNVIVTGGCIPNATSNNVSLIINTSPTITSQPSNQTTCIGSSITFTVAASGTGLTYQWRKGLVNLINGLNISGATTASLTINPVNLTDAALNYNVVVSGACLPDAISNNASLNIGTSPTITSQPSNQTVCEGSSVTFTVAASGTGLTYQWRKGLVNLINGGSISGATTPSLTIYPTALSDAALNYNVIVSGTCLPNAISNNAALIINTAPIAIANSNSPICVGNTINLSANLVAGVTYSWTSSTGFTSSSQNPTISSSTTSNTGTYSLTLSNGNCTSATSTIAVLVNNCGVDLSIVKTVNTINPIVGNTVVFTITAKNNSSANATGVIVTDVLQSGYTYISSSATVGSYNTLNSTWTIGNLNSGASEVLTMTVTVISSGNYVNTATIDGNEFDGDLSNNSSTIETYPLDFNIPEGFSPNGDGINDLFIIRGIKNYPNNNFTIFNRWGDKVFDASPYENTWNGSCSKGIQIGGDALPTGTYFYVIDLGDGSKVIKGTIYLNR